MGEARRIRIRWLFAMAVVATMVGATAYAVECIEATCGVTGFSIEIHNNTSLTRCYAIRWEGGGCTKDLSTCAAPVCLNADETDIFTTDWSGGTGTCPPSPAGGTIYVQTCGSSGTCQLDCP